MTIYTLINLCDETVISRLDVILTSNVAGLPLKTEHRYPLVSTIITLDETERDLFLRLHISHMYVDSDDQILVKVE